MQYDALCSYELLLQAFTRVKKNDGSPGVDSQTIVSFEGELALGLNSILYDLTNRQYEPQPLKRSQLKLPGKKPRWLAFPTVRDRIVHTAIAIMLQPYLEDEFEHNSYGYRPGRSYLMAVEKVIEHRNLNRHYVFDADINGYFDHIPQASLLTKLQQTAIDPLLISLIFSLLFDQQSIDGNLVFGKAHGLGIPQGSSICPLLANFYLDELDEHMIKQGYHMVRYADDFVICCDSAKSAQHAQYHTEQVLNHLSLTLNEEKTQLTTFAEGFRFLGHNFLGEQVIDEKSSLVFGVMDNAKEWTISAAEYQQEQQLLQLDTPANWHHKAIEDEQDWLDLPAHLLQQPSTVQRKVLKTLYLTQVGSVVGIRGNRAYLSFHNETVKTWPLSVLDAVIVMGRIQLTTDFLGYCSEHGILIILASSTGRYKGEVTNYPKNLDVLQKQVTQFCKPGFERALSENMLKAKFNNCQRVLEQQARRKTLSTGQCEQLNGIIKNLNKAKNQILTMTTRQQHFLLEARVAKQYFSGLIISVTEQWQFSGRNRLPPKDPINALLSLGYNLLFNNLHCLVRKHGLHPDIGFLHCGKHQPSLVLDLMEPFRALVVDATVLKLINKQQLKPSDFVYQAGQCLLSQGALKLFITAIEEKCVATFHCKQSKQLKDYRKAMSDQVFSLRAYLTQQSEFKAFKVL